MAISIVIGIFLIASFAIVYNRRKKGYTTFVIPKNSHYGLHGTKILFLKDGDSLKFRVMFEESCRYQTQEPENQLDINKLLGFTDNTKNVHYNSARYGWAYNPNSDKIDLYSYCYRDTRRIYKYLYSIDLESWVDLEIVLLEDKYKFVHPGGYVYQNRSKIKDVEGLFFMCYPYFGGTEKTTHKMKINIDIYD